MSIVEKEIVSLVFYKPEYKEMLSRYSLSKEQQRYTALPLDALQKCESESERHPIVILYGNQPAGFFVLHGWEGVKEFSENKNALLLRAYSINAGFQGKGIASESIRLLPSFVKEFFPHADEIILAVNHGNLIAQNVYKKGGIVDKGIRALGREGEMYIYHMGVQDEPFVYFWDKYAGNQNEKRGSNMPALTQLSELKLVGFRVLCPGDQYIKEIPKASKQLSDRLGEIKNVVNPSLQYGAFVVETDSNENDGYWVCVEVTGFKEVPEGMVTLTIPSQNYAVIRHCGSNVLIRDTYHLLHQWVESNGYQRLKDKWHLEIFHDWSDPDNLDMELLDTVDLQQ